MPKFNDHQVKEINELIEKINKALEAMGPKKKCQIGARDRAVLSMLLKVRKMDGAKVSYFDCQRQYSDEIVGYFIKEKGVARSVFTMNAQTHIFLLLA